MARCCLDEEKRVCQVDIAKCSTKVGLDLQELGIFFLTNQDHSHWRVTTGEYGNEDSGHKGWMPMPNSPCWLNVVFNTEDGAVEESGCITHGPAASGVFEKEMGTHGDHLDSSTFQSMFSIKLIYMRSAILYCHELCSSWCCNKTSLVTTNRIHGRTAHLIKCPRVLFLCSSNKAWKLT